MVHLEVEILAVEDTSRLWGEKIREEILAITGQSIGRSFRMPGHCIWTNHLKGGYPHHVSVNSQRKCISARILAHNRADQLYEGFLKKEQAGNGCFDHASTRPKEPGTWRCRIVEILGSPKFSDSCNPLKLSSSMQC